MSESKLKDSSISQNFSLQYNIRDKYIYFIRTQPKRLTTVTTTTNGHVTITPRGPGRYEEWRLGPLVDPTPPDPLRWSTVNSETPPGSLQSSQGQCRNGPFKPTTHYYSTVSVVGPLPPPPPASYKVRLFRWRYCPTSGVSRSTQSY